LLFLPFHQGVFERETSYTPRMKFAQVDPRRVSETLTHYFPLFVFFAFFSEGLWPGTRSTSPSYSIRHPPPPSSGTPIISRDDMGLFFLNLFPSPCKKPKFPDFLSRGPPSLLLLGDGGCKLAVLKVPPDPYQLGVH